MSLMKEFESARNVFDDLNNPYKMIKYFESEYSLVKPTEVFLGHRADTTRRGGLVKQSLTANTFQYISILETLKFIFCNERMQSGVDNKENLPLALRERTGQEVMGITAKIW